MTALYLAIVTGRIRPNQLVTDMETFQRHFKECLLVRAPGVKPVGELWAIICLDTLNGIGEALYTVLDKLGGGISLNASK